MSIKLFKYLLTLLFFVLSSSWKSSPTVMTRFQDYFSADQKLSTAIMTEIRGGSEKVQKKGIKVVKETTRSKGFLASFVGSIYKICKFLLPSSFTSEKPPRYGKGSKTKNNGKKKRKEKSELSSSTDSASNRIQKELKSFLADPPENCELSVGKNIRSWIITLTGVQGTIFGGEKYKLQVNFPKEYPTKPPSVFFLKPCPKHVHVYSNGDICLNLLGRDWRPTMTVQG